GYVSVTQALLPLLLASAKTGREAVIVNKTSILSVMRTPFHAAYSASKVAVAMFNYI
ncbi:uncharacterized protein CC84DRAFT_1099957, partial [Paraphaeosphaeria sporulosa]